MKPKKPKNNMKQQPEHRNLIYETTTRRSKQEARTRKIKNKKPREERKG